MLTWQGLLGVADHGFISDDVIIENACGWGSMRGMEFALGSADALPKLVLPPVRGISIVAVDEAYDGLGATYTCYVEDCERDSINDTGMPLLSGLKAPGRETGDRCGTGTLRRRRGPERGAGRGRSVRRDEAT
jgi:hypothetical protein